MSRPLEATGSLPRKDQTMTTDCHNSTTSNRGMASIGQILREMYPSFPDLNPPEPGK